jgi:hypothetical protein
MSFLSKYASISTNNKTNSVNRTWLLVIVNNLKHPETETKGYQKIIISTSFYLQQHHIYLQLLYSDRIQKNNTECQIKLL